MVRGADGTYTPVTTEAEERSSSAASAVSATSDAQVAAEHEVEQQAAMAASEVAQDPEHDETAGIEDEEQLLAYYEPFLLGYPVSDLTPAMSAAKSTTISKEQLKKKDARASLASLAGLPRPALRYLASTTPFARPPVPRQQIATSSAGQGEKQTREAIKYLNPFGPSSSTTAATATSAAPKATSSLAPDFFSSNVARRDETFATATEQAEPAVPVVKDKNAGRVSMPSRDFDSTPGPMLAHVLAGRMLDRARSRFDSHADPRRAYRRKQQAEQPQQDGREQVEAAQDIRQPQRAKRGGRAAASSRVATQQQAQKQVVEKAAPAQITTGGPGSWRSLLDGAARFYARNASTQSSAPSSNATVGHAAADDSAVKMSASSSEASSSTRTDDGDSFRLSDGVMRLEMLPSAPDSNVIAGQLFIMPPSSAPAAGGPLGATTSSDELESIAAAAEAAANGLSDSLPGAIEIDSSSPGVLARFFENSGVDNATAHDLADQIVRALEAANAPEGTAQEALARLARHRVADPMGDENVIWLDSTKRKRKKKVTKHKYKKRR